MAKLSNNRCVTMWNKKAVGKRRMAWTNCMAVCAPNQQLCRHFFFATKSSPGCASAWHWRHASAKSNSCTLFSTATQSFGRNTRVHFFVSEGKHTRVEGRSGSTETRWFFIMVCWNSYSQQNSLTVGQAKRPITRKFDVGFVVKPVQRLRQQHWSAESNNGGIFRSVRCSNNFQSIARFISILRHANRSRQLAPVRLDPLKGARLLIWRWFLFEEASHLSVGRAPSWCLGSDVRICSHVLF